MAAEWPATPSADERALVHGMIFDCEEWMLEIKLAEMGDEIHRFIIVEGAYSLQNMPRAQCFPSIAKANPAIARWMHKIVYVYDAEPVPDFRYWEAEVYYRDLIGLRGLPRIPGLRRGDLVLISDLDEILSRQFLRYLRFLPDDARTLIEVPLLWTYYSFAWVNPHTWHKSMIASVRELDLLAGNRTNAVRFDLLGRSSQAWRPEGLAGWHCSWCMPTADFVSKLAHFAHSELNTPAHSSMDYLQRVRKEGLWLAGAEPNGCLQRRGLQAPAHALRHPERFSVLLAPY